jgi:hypothetical protein
VIKTLGNTFAVRLIKISAFTLPIVSNSTVTETATATMATTNKNKPMLQAAFV